MRLFLSSERPGARSAALLSIIERPDGGSVRAAVIANGHDHGTPARDGHRAESAAAGAELVALGLVPEPVDLRAHFGDPQSLARRLSGVDLVWVPGGNSFVLRRAMRLSGFDTLIRERLAADAIAYGGFGAGAVVAGPNLYGMELMDDPFEVPPLYDEPPIWHGLGLTPFAIVPHYRSRHPGAAAADKVVSYLSARKMRHRALADGDVIVRTGNLERLAS